MSSDVVLVLTTVPEGDSGEALAAALVEERLAACVNLQGPMMSFYRWQGVVERAIERQVVIKTTRHRVEAVKAKVAELHSYALPELVVLSIGDGSAEYLEWVRTETRSI